MNFIEVLDVLLFINLVLLVSISQYFNVALPQEKIFLWEIKM